MPTRNFTRAQATVKRLVFIGVDWQASGFPAVVLVYSEGDFDAQASHARPSFRDLGELLCVHRLQMNAHGHGHGHGHEQGRTPAAPRMLDMADRRRGSQGKLRRGASIARTSHTVDTLPEIHLPPRSFPCRVR